MRSKFTVFYGLLFLFLGATHRVCAQATSRAVILNLPQVALVDIEPNTTSVALNFTAPTEAGMPVVAPAVNTTKWLNYTSAIGSTAAKRTITAQIDQLVPGIQIRLTAGNAQATGAGVLGTPVSQVTLTTVPIAIITGIGGAYTGNGINNGHALSLSLVISNYALLMRQNNKIITITYTITN